MVGVFERVAWLIPLVPLLAFGLFMGWGKRLHGRYGDRIGWLSVAAIALPCLIAVGIFVSRVQQTADAPHPPPAYEANANWSAMGVASLFPTRGGHFDGTFRLGFSIDNLTAAMLLMVTFVAMLIQIYSIGYMATGGGHGGDGEQQEHYYWRFFAYLSLFCFSMLLLVLANNLLLLYAGWELVGLCSYLLIGFEFWRKAAANAGKKAFIVNRIGDFGFLLGVMVCFYHCPSLSLRDLFTIAGTTAFPTAWVGAAAALLFCGAVGKSAQFPLHVWLPDAMEGPTPVSALIHAATMVAAGVYMVARIYTLFFFSMSQPVLAGLAPLDLVKWIGIITAVMAGIIAVTQADIKRVLAYSTVSQLGFMMFGLGCLGYVAAVFHLLTHAFFKALLFLGSGSVIHGCGGVQDMWRMGGLRRSMRITFLTFIAGTLALVGFPLTSGFFSKDEIMAAAWNNDQAVFWLGLLAAFCTAFYMMRLCMLTFWTGDRPRDAAIHPHESSRVMTTPLVVLAIFALLLGFVGMPGKANLFGRFVAYEPLHELAATEAPAAEGRGAVEGTDVTATVTGVDPGALADALSVAEGAGAKVEHALNPLVMGLSTCAALSGLLLGYVMYGTRLLSPNVLKWIPLYRASRAKFWFDELYQATFVRGCLRAADGCALFDRVVVDGAVNAVGWVTRSGFAWAVGLTDRYVVDGLVNLVAWANKTIARLSNGLQTGHVQQYIAAGAVGVGLIAAAAYAVDAGLVGTVMHTVQAMLGRG